MVGDLGCLTGEAGMGPLFDIIFDTRPENTAGYKMCCSHAKVAGVVECCEHLPVVRTQNEWSWFTRQTGEYKGTDMLGN